MFQILCTREDILLQTYVPVKFGEPFVFEAREVMTFVGSFRKEVNRTKMLDFFVTVES